MSRSPGDLPWAAGGETLIWGLGKVCRPGLRDENGVQSRPKPCYFPRGRGHVESSRHGEELQAFTEEGPASWDRVWGWGGQHPAWGLADHVRLPQTASKGVSRLPPRAGSTDCQEGKLGEGRSCVPPTPYSKQPASIDGRLGTERDQSNSRPNEINA